MKWLPNNPETSAESKACKDGVNLSTLAQLSLPNIRGRAGLPQFIAAVRA